ncbi:MAG TPA: hypothetical protein VGF06_10085 [Terriglobales bacterium]|jgi:hypothetical protein
MSRVVRRTYRCFVVPYLAAGLLLLTAGASAQRGALTIHRNLAELTQQAGTIVRGHVTVVRTEPHPELSNLTTVVISLHVDSLLKGNAPTNFTFRQFVWDIRDKYEAAGYRKGQELLLLLNPVSTYGLTSPAGMDQGRFVITRDAKGHATAVNGYGNAGLFSGFESELRQRKLQLTGSSLVMVSRPSGPAPLPELEALIKQFAGAK